MKYLKRIFENDLYNQVDEVELKDFCETYLAYVLDDNSFDIEVVERPNWDSYIVWLTKRPVVPPFKWDDIKDYYIPFVTMLSREYDLNDKDLDQRGSSIIINFFSGNQLFVTAAGIEDWDGRLGGEFDTKFYNGNGIREIGIVVKNTIKI
jgi:hypothetical protein